MKISVIVPIYKVEKYIRECVESIIGQSYENLEIILVDDGSPDNCPAICDEYAKSDNRVKVVHKNNGGLMSARQAGLEVAVGDYVTFVDGDDSIEPDMYARFADAIGKYSPDMALCEFYYSFSDRKEPSKQHLEKEFYTKAEMEAEIYPAMLFSGEYYEFGVMPCCWSKLFKRELLERHLYSVDQRIKMGEDAAFTYPCLLEAESLAYISAPLYNYRQENASMSNSYDANMADTILIPYRILKKSFGKYEGRYNLDRQLNMYLFYLLNVLLRNESKSSNSRTAKYEKMLLRETISNDVAEEIKLLDNSAMPARKKLVKKMIAGKKTDQIWLYLKVIGRF